MPSVKYFFVYLQPEWDMEGLNSPSFYFVFKNKAKIGIQQDCLKKQTSRQNHPNKNIVMIEEWLEGKEYFLVDINVDKENRITVEIDHKDGVWIEDCCQLSRFIEEHFDREEEDYELEVGSAGIGQPLKVLQQYINLIGKEVEVMTSEGKKLSGILEDANAETFKITYAEKQKLEGKKRPVLVDVQRDFSYDNVKWVKAVIDF